MHLRCEKGRQNTVDELGMDDGKTDYLRCQRVAVGMRNSNDETLERECTQFVGHLLGGERGRVAGTPRHTQVFVGEAHDSVVSHA